MMFCWSIPYLRLIGMYDVEFKCLDYVCDVDYDINFIRMVMLTNVPYYEVIRSVLTSLI